MAVQQKKYLFQVMFWGAMSSEISVSRPSLSWIPESIEEKWQNVLKLREINTYWQKKADDEILRARTVGTLEYEYMETLNRDIQEGKSKWKRPRRPSQEFGDMESWSRGRVSENQEVSKGGID
ncbi:hypothetical protein GMDG_04043 [Pseudogymnoascus destructans 20631-21]|uniref:Uncharacterized protein n=1 Tax=Pseudogymnoascus destructans (strain ATCC MYA-4855 / 20631-21) TaxID=658429 RepID=L8GA71_PSED2|nr:hypothetical protein GMDG_04043 [Pseudogymnoascus destructans 20631-21]